MLRHSTKLDSIQIVDVTLSIDIWPQSVIFIKFRVTFSLSPMMYIDGYFQIKTFNGSWVIEQMFRVPVCKDNKCGLAVLYETTHSPYLIGCHSLAMPKCMWDQLYQKYVTLKPIFHCEANQWRWGLTLG